MPIASVFCHLDTMDSMVDTIECVCQCERGEGVEVVGESFQLLSDLFMSVIAVTRLDREGRT